MSESKCLWLTGWDSAGTLGLLKDPAPGPGVSSGPAASPWGSPFPASACIHIQNYVLQQLIHVIPSAVVGLRDMGCMGPEPVLVSRVVGTWKWGLGEQWYHQLLGLGWRCCVGALLLGTQPGMRPASAPAPLRGY